MGAQGKGPELKGIERKGKAAVDGKGLQSRRGELTGMAELDQRVGAELGTDRQYRIGWAKTVRDANRRERQQWIGIDLRGINGNG